MPSIDPLAFVPPDIAPWFALLLLVASFFTSALTAAMGLGGGVAMLAILGTGLPVASVLPVHGLVQLGSNAGRAVIQRQHIVWPVVAGFSLGALIGVAMGGPVVAWIPEAVARLLLAGFILWSIFGRKPRPSAIGARYLIGGGMASSFASMLVGATGPLVAAILAAKGLLRQPLIATHAACMVAQHGLKILMFGLLGFAYAEWAPLLAAMIASGVAGSYLGSRILDRMPERRFRLVFNAIMLALSLQIAASAVRQLLA